MQINIDCKRVFSSKVFATVGAIALTAGAFFNGFDGSDLRTFGAVVVTASLVRIAMCPAMKPSAEMFEMGHEVGYAHGYKDGRRIGHPTMVAPIRIPDDVSDITGN